MALVLKDRIKETSNTTGQGTLTLTGAVDGFRTFADIGNTNTTYYCITDGNNFEVGIGTYTLSDSNFSNNPTLARTTVLQTSAGNTTKISCTGNQKVFVTQPASKAAYLDASNALVVNNTPLSTIQQRWTKTSGSNQTAFSGAADSSGPTLAVNSTSHVFLNGIFLKETTDYALSGGTTVTLTAGATLNDIVEVITFTPLTTATTGITSGKVPVFTSGVADNDFLKIDGTSVEGRSASEVLSDIGGQSALTFGIANTNAVKVDSGSVADDEYARFTSSGLESRATSEVLSDIGALSTSVASSTYMPLSGGTFTGAISGTNATLSGYLRGPSSFTIDPAAHGDNSGTVVIAGNLQVDGTTTTINSTTVAIDDKIFSIATDAADSAAANSSGITIGGAGATILYTHATTSWDFNKSLNITGGADASTFFRSPNFYTGVGSQGLVNHNTNDLKLVSQSGDTHINMVNDLAVELHHNNAKKLETTSSGVLVTGGKVQSTDDLVLTTSTSDGADDHYVGIDAGNGAGSTSRGGMVYVHGNEHSSNGGNVFICAGIGGEVQFATGSNGDVQARVDANGHVRIVGENNSGSTPLGKLANSQLILDHTTHTNAISQIGFGYTASQTYSSASIGYVSTSQASSGKGDLFFATRDSTSDAVPVERMKITSSGTFGLNTSDPSPNASVSVFGKGSSNYHGMSIRNTDSDNTNKGGVAISGSQKANADDIWAGVGFWDDGTRRLMTYGGGGWGYEEATEHRFYAGSYGAGSGNAPEAVTIASSGVVTATGFSGKIHPVSGTTTNYLHFESTNELNFKNVSGTAQELYVNYSGGNLNLCGNTVAVVHNGTNSEPRVLVKGNGVGYTHGAISLQSNTGSDPHVRGQGMYLFNEGNDTTWYVGTSYLNTSAGSRPFDFNFESGTTSLSHITAAGDSTASGQSLPRCKVRIHAGGVISAPSGIELGSGLDATAAHTLDDYEEGSFTPTGNNITLSTAEGRYTKIGNVVRIGMLVIFPSTSDSSDASIGSLPFTSTNLQSARGGLSIAWHDVSSSNGLAILTQSNGTNAIFYLSNTAKTNANMSGRAAYVAGTYITDS